MKKTLILIGFLSLLNIFASAQTRGLYVTDNNGGVTAPSTEKRYALVMGNNAYQNVSSLKNPINDAVDMAETLKTLGFEVETLTDAGLVASNNAIKRLAQKAKGQNAVALFFYSGHGLQVNNDNWIVPVDANSQSPADVQAACVSLKFLMDQLEQANAGTNIVILDACRNNPFSYSRNTGGGLAQPSKVPTGTYIAFATSPYTTASDGTGRNSPYTVALKTAIKVPNIKIEDMFKQVRREVKRIGQTPWENSSLEGDFYFNPTSERRDEPAKDSDGDGIIDPQDACPYEYGERSNRGCPLPVGKDYVETKTGRNFTMKYLTGSTFSMGSNEDNDEKPIHTVNVGTFFMSKYEVTFNEYDAFCEATGHEKPKDEGWGRGTRPVINVSWDDANAYCAWLSEKSGKKYRLPTETEWEFAAKGGQSYKYSGSDNVKAVAWMSENSESKTHPVGERDANGFGLYDMSGNVWEWCSDWYKGYQGSSGVSDYTGSYRVFRGGGWSNSASNCRAANRLNSTPTLRYHFLGFRVCSSLQ